MPIPSTAVVWEYVMDPADVVDFEFEVSGMLEAGEAVDSYTLTVLPDATALGLTLGTGAYAPVSVDPVTWRIWLSVDASQQDNPAFDGTGATLPLELTVVTDSTPARTRQRTLVVKVAQQ